MDVPFELHVNDKVQQVVTDPARPLLDVLREDLALTGTKYGCGEGECGACTVLLDGRAARSCITAVSDAVGTKIVTIEGIASADILHPVQQAFIEKHAAQCGYCVPGQILSAVAFLRENPRPTREAMIEALRGNICRCCNYPNLLAAVQRAGELVEKEAPQ